MGWRRAVSITIERWHPGLRRRRDQHGVLRDRGQRPARTGLLGFAVNGSTRPRTSATSCTASKCFPRSFRSPTRTPTSAPSTTRSRASSGTTSPPSRTTTTATSSTRWPARRRISTGPEDGLDRGPDRAPFRRGARRVLQPRRRLEPGVRAGIRQPVAQRPAVAGKRRKALQWLSRDLDEAMIAFIKSARSGVRSAAASTSSPIRRSAALARRSPGVDVQLVVDCKVNEHTRREAARRHRESRVLRERPAARNLAAITDAGLPASAVIRREARRSDLTHNKFMVLLAGDQRTPQQVWTGSTNLTDGGIHGQANTGHWIRDAATAARFLELLEAARRRSRGPAG